MYLPALMGVVRELEFGMCKPHGELFRKKGRWPDREPCRDGCQNRRSRRRNGRELRLWNGCDYRRHYDVAWCAGVTVKCRAYVAKHDRASQSSGNRAKSQVALGVRDLLGMTFFETRFQPLRKVR